MRIFDGFDDKDEMIREFSRDPWSDDYTPCVQPSQLDVIYAWYECADYEGDAFVLYRDTDTGKLMEVNGEHCSCFGLEEQWSPEEVNVTELIGRIERHVADVDNPDTYTSNCGPQRWGTREHVDKLLEYLREEIA